MESKRLKKKFFRKGSQTMKETNFSVDVLQKQMSARNYDGNSS